MLLNVVYCLLKTLQAKRAHTLIKSQIRFVGNTEMSRRIDNKFIKFEDRVFLIHQMCWYSSNISIKTNTEKTALTLYILKKFLFSHNNLNLSIRWQLPSCAQCFQR